MKDKITLKELKLRRVNKLLEYLNSKFPDKAKIISEYSDECRDDVEWDWDASYKGAIFLTLIFGGIITVALIGLGFFMRAENPWIAGGIGLTITLATTLYLIYYYKGKRHQCVELEDFSEQQKLQFINRAEWLMTSIEGKEHRKNTREKKEAERRETIEQFDTVVDAIAKK